MRASTQSRSAAIWLLLAAALLVRALVPVGYMPDKAEDGTISIAICHSDTVLALPLKNADRSQEDRKSRDHPACSFASLAGAADRAPELASLAPRLARDVTFAAHAQSFALTHAAHLVPPSTGPPLPA